jgi:hypothetical protein
MKLFPRSSLCALALGLALGPAVALADYQSAENALARLENCVRLSPAQEREARQIFQNLKDIMDDLSPADRPVKGMQSRQDAMAAIRGILTPEQQAIYDRTPQRLGGGMTAADPAMRALRAKISAFVRQAARDAPEVAAAVGTVQKVALDLSGSTTRTGDAQKYEDPALHPDSGTNLVRVTGSAGVKTFKVTWKMDEAGNLSVDKIAAADR